MDPGTLSAVQAFAAVAMILVGVAVAATALRWVWLRTGRPALPETSGQFDAVLGRLEEQEHRVAELEERLDFAERLLAKQQEPQRLGGGA